MTPEVEQAVEELRACFPDAGVEAIGTGDGGAFVRISSIDPGHSYAKRETWIGFMIGHQYPYSDIYPLFVCPHLVRSDGRALGEGFSMGSFQGEAALQLSRRSNRLDPSTDTAALKVTKVLEWLQAQ